MARKESDDNGGQFRARYLDAIRGAACELERYSALPVDRAAFVDLYYGQADAEDLAREPRLLAAAALSHLEWAATRAPNTAKLRVFNPTLERDGWTSEHTIVQTANDDMPFLVDSLTMNLSSIGHAAHVTIHPLLRVERGAKGELVAVHSPRTPAAAGGGKTESFIHFEIVRETGAELLASIETTLQSTLRDVRAAVEDWQTMLVKLRVAADELRNTKSLPAAEMLAESCLFLEWLASNNFTLLGYREYELVHGEDFDELKTRPGTGLGILRDDAANRDAMRLVGAARDEAHSKNPLVITKANRRSTVHRPAPLDYVGVKVFGADGHVRSERRFLGLFTSVAYNQSPRDIPLLRLKVRRLMQESGFDPKSHRGKSLQHILDTLPRDDLIQGSIDDLRAISEGTLGLQERHRLRLFCRRDVFGRFFSCLVYVPREQYNPRSHRAIESVLLAGLGGTEVESEVAISESALARLSVKVKTVPGQHEKPDIAALQADLESAVRTWTDRLRETLLAKLPEDRALALLHELGERFSAAYQDEVDPARASHDIQKIAQVRDRASDLEMALERSANAPEQRLRFTTFRRDDPIPLHVALPVLENMGFKVISERVFSIRLPATAVWIQDFELEKKQPLDTAAVGERFKECFASVLRGDAENDGFNGLVVSAALHWREAALLRAFCKYILQTGIRFSQSYMQEVLGRYSAFCRALVEKFAARCDVDMPHGCARRPTCSERCRDPSRARPSREPRRRPNSAGVRVGRERDPAHELLSERRRSREAVRLLQARSEQDPGAAEAATEVRNFRLLAARRRRASARLESRSRRHSLVGSARGLPDGGPWLDESAASEEHRHRADRRERRFRLQGVASGRRPRRDAARSRGLLQDFHPRACSTSPTTSSTARSRRPNACCGTTTTIRTSSSRPTRARPRSPISRTRCLPSARFGSATRSPRAARPATTTRKWRSLRAVLGRP